MSNNNETKRDRFVRLAENRTNKIINMIQLLGNCANTSNYEYTEDDVEKIFAAIDASIKETRRKFAKVDTSKNNKFSLNK